MCIGNMESNYEGQWLPGFPTALNEDIILHLCRILLEATQCQHCPVVRTSQRATSNFVGLAARLLY